ncbi:TlpA disulfide reductase family protein [sulfur-oxidizing endosymbiont of Gigantopelta aegis]|uniref:TlpA disulfide reductase family protein n=1 Tax=sulfur-oxidizing endosymbiont of Gigantopelta aegis TaxID=2794934 RepID=UPI0018DBF333|nr:TlpA disulfide reductase family protein [sulfur-oxidizing endosymbiont of Gigantopelta aegis]
MLVHSEQFLLSTEGSELEVQVYKARGKNLLLIMPSEHGITDGLKKLTTDLQTSGVEVWLADPFSSWMLPVVESSLEKIPNIAYVEFIHAAQQYAKKNNKRIYLLSHDKGSRKLLESVRQWQLDSNKLISGVILISPNLYSKTPDAGNEAKLLPITYATNLPLFLYIPEKSTLALRIRNIVNSLETGGSDVFVKRLNNVRDRFFFRPDASEKEITTASGLSQQILQSLKLTQSYAQPRKAASLAAPTAIINENNQPQTKAKKTTGVLRIYKGSLKPDDFKLKALNDKTHKLSDYRDKVVLVNFWASWCPPCVHEIPSMSELNASVNDTLSNKSFEILAINLGEPKQDIATFIEAHPVNFSVLLDPQKSLPKQWKVFAFPTSYLLDKQGRIRYSVAGAIDWNSHEVKTIINRLINQ